MKPRVVQQRGAALLVALVMLVVLTLLAVSAINTSTVNLRIVDNEQRQEEAEQRAQEAIEQTIDTIHYFSNQEEAPTLDGVAAGATVERRTCVSATPTTGYSAVWSLTPDDTVWEVTSTYTDDTSGAEATVTQGVRIILPSGNCVP